MASEVQAVHYVMAGRRREADEARREALVVPMGCLLMVAMAVLLGASMYAIVVSKLLPDTGVWLLDAVKHDHYYCYLLPACIPATMLFIYINWLSLKFFRHN